MYKATFENMSSQSNYLQPCDTKTVTEGEWHYGTLESSDFGRCPIFNDTIMSKSFLGRQYSYMCSKYLSAKYVPKKCYLLTMDSAMNLISSKVDTGVVTFMGDSLMIQQNIAASCDTEFLNRTFKTHLIANFFLRPDISCYHECLVNDTYREINYRSFPDFCRGCPDGILRNLTIDQYTFPTWWMSFVLPDTKVLIMNTGAWYNMHMGIRHSALRYVETLDILKHILRQYVAHNIIVVWLALPPFFDVFSQYHIQYEWDLFEERNAIAKKELEKIGVIYVDVSTITFKRKEFDKDCSIDGLHWW